MSGKSTRGAALITGASAGIGAAYAERLARRGHDLILVARDGARLEANAERLRRETGVAVDVMPADLTVRDDLHRVEARLREDAALTLLVNNAGVFSGDPFVSLDPDALEALIQLNVTAVARLALAAATNFSRQGRGTVVNIGSTIGLGPEVGRAAYGATKAYVNYLTQSLHEELGAAGVTFQVVLPGPTATEIWTRSGYDAGNIPAGRMMGVDEMVDAALVGLDRGELVTMPTLADPADWDAYHAARRKLAPSLSGGHAAARYQVTT